MVNVHITGNFLDNSRYLPVLFPHLGPLKNEKRLFSDKGYLAFTEPSFNLVADPMDADFILLPHEYFDVLKKDKAFLDEHIALSGRTGKKLLIFDLSDYTDKEIDVPNAIVFRIAGYGHARKTNEIIMPCFVEDMLVGRNIAFRKKDDKPVIGFCGWAGFGNFRSWLGFYLKNHLITIKKIVSGDRNMEAHRQGIYFRKKALYLLVRSAAVKTNFIIRKSYSSHKNTIEADPGKIRKEYLDNMLSSDFALCVRGDANISTRFFEALSLGRIPLLINTDCILPLEDVLEYKKFIISVDYRDISKIAVVVSEFYNSMSDDDFIAMQKGARRVFEEYLKPDAFLRYILPRLAEKTKL